MTRTALVTGSPERVAAVSTALANHDCEVVPVDDLGTLVEVCASLGQGAVDHYVQLPVNVPSSGGTVVSRLQAFLASGLLARFEAVSAVLGTLRPNASVVLVAGNLPAELTAPDDHQARIALLRVLVQAILADTAPIPVRTVVVDHMRTPEEIAAIAVDPAANRVRVISDVAERYPEMDYVDWRLEVLSLATIES
ncbi:MAG: hypothetical protein ABSD78_11300 [Acidimicrobiales bacterium]|jgi:hypothetical protein